MFTSGDILIVKPQDADDPEALLHEGERCRFNRYVDTAFGSRFGVVQFSTQGRKVVFREGDLALPPSGDDTTATMEAQ